MLTIRVREVRKYMARIIKSVARGQGVIVLRRDEPADRLTRFPDRSELRAELPPMTESVRGAVRGLRDAERF